MVNLERGRECFVGLRVSILLVYRSLYCLVLELNHFWDPVGLLGVVEGDALALQVGDGGVLRQNLPRKSVLASIKTAIFGLFGREFGLYYSIYALANMTRTRVNIILNTQKAHTTPNKVDVSTYILRSLLFWR